MGFKKSRKQQNQEFWRTIFIWTIGLSIPCYALAFFVYAFVPRQAERIRPTEETVITATWTPIDPSVILTQRALTNPAPTALFPSSTPFDNFTSEPIFFTPAPFFTSTPAPTRFITSTPNLNPPTATTAPTIAQPTVQPTDAPPIILPPTDTPNP